MDNAACLNSERKDFRKVWESCEWQRNIKVGSIVKRTPFFLERTDINFDIVIITIIPIISPLRSNSIQIEKDFLGKCSPCAQQSSDILIEKVIIFLAGIDIPMVEVSPSPALITLINSPFPLNLVTHWFSTLLQSGHNNTNKNWKRWIDTSMKYVTAIIIWLP